MKNEITKLKYWLDSEVSVLHVYLLVIIWLLAHSRKAHIIVGVLVIINVVYAWRRALALPKDYLTVKEKFRDNSK